MSGFRRRSVSRAPRTLAVLAFLCLPLPALSQAPTVTRVLPAFGPVGGNNIVIVGGTNFQAGATVTFGGSPASSVIVNNATTLTAKPPAHAAGLVTVAVTNPNAQSGNLANAYKYLAPAGTFGLPIFPDPCGRVCHGHHGGPGRRHVVYRIRRLSGRQNHHGWRTDVLSDRRPSSRHHARSRWAVVARGLPGLRWRIGCLRSVLDERSAHVVPGSQSRPRHRESVPAESWPAPTGTCGSSSPAAW
jgi:hypothetical protein